ncbi:hypothetical protein COCVIDRAFT_115804, partial [Bipolaris victoriae FI3]
RSPLVIMTRDISAQRHRYTSNSYTQALEEGLLPIYRAGQHFMQDNALIYKLNILKD